MRSSAFEGGDAASRSVMVVGNFLSGGICTRAVCEDLSDRLEARQWQVIRTSARRQRTIRLLDMVSSAWVRRNEYSVAHVDVFSGPAFVWAEAVCYILRRLRKPYVLTLHGGALPSLARRWPGRMRRLLDSAAAVTTPSRYLLEQMRSYGKDLLLLPNALELAAYEFTLREHAKPRLIWLRAFHESYNPEMAVRVAALLRQEFPEARLTMTGRDMGDGSLERCRKLAAELGISEAVSFAGGAAKSEVPQRLNEGDIFFNTTNVESYGVSVMEAAACGLCIVSTDAGELPYLWENGESALLVSQGDSEAMAEAVRRILTEPGLAAHLSENARRKAQQFDWSIVLPQWESLLASVAGGGGP